MLAINVEYGGGAPRYGDLFGQASGWARGYAKQPLKNTRSAPETLAALGGSRAAQAALCPASS